MQLCYIILIILAVFVSPAIGTQIDDSSDNWIDPNDPLANYKKHVDQLEVCTQAFDSAEPTLKLIIRSLLQQLQVEPNQGIGFYRMASAVLTDFEVGVINDYLEASRPSPAQHNSLRNSLSKIFTVHDGVDSPSRLQLLFRTVEPWLVPLNLFVAILFAFWLLRQLFSSGSFFRVLILVLFVISLYTSYNRMYQERMAKRIADSFERTTACQAQGLLSRSFNFARSLVSVQKKSDCVAFVESQTVSILFEISPIDVLFDVIGNGVFSLMEHFAARFNRAFVALYDGLPLHLQLVITAAVFVIFFFLLMFGVMRYRIGFWGFKFEPTPGEASLLGHVGTTVSAITRALDPPTPPNSTPLSLQNVTPRSRARMRRMLEQNSDESLPLVRRSLSAPRL